MKWKSKLGTTHLQWQNVLHSFSKFRMKLSFWHSLFNTDIMYNFILAKSSRNLSSKPIEGNTKSLNNWNIRVLFINLFGKNWNRGIKFFAEMCATLQHPSSFPSSTPCRKTTGALTEICIQIGCPSFFFSICLLNSICNIQGRRSFFQQLIFHIQIEHGTCYDLART